MRTLPTAVTAPDLAGANWFTSSYSHNGGECVEAAINLPGAVPIRDTKNVDGPVLMFLPAAWTSFVHGVRQGDFRTV
ncbi:DUF397 domain-containing protein [Streptomyces sp. NPDC093085]|uniref:DUF397 domain-containing protein n=1 Tax=Streptomyces sp. NPDC093085 TaxID=3155068 RepID=UPI0034130561